MKTKLGNILAISSIVGLLLYGNMIQTKKPVKLEQKSPILLAENGTPQDKETEQEPASVIPKAKKGYTFRGKTKQEIILELDPYFTSSLSGKTTQFVDHALSLGLDPYLSLAIVLEETGCAWGCSTLVRECNNIGGQKGSPSCNGGSYRSYPTLEEGINGFLDNLYYNYYQKGLKTPEQINQKYASSPTWAEKINRYIAKIQKD